MSKGCGVEWHSVNRLDGDTRYLMWDFPGRPLFFQTRREARIYIRDHYADIRERAYLRAEPHGWKMPQPVRVEVKVEKIIR